MLDNINDRLRKSELAIVFIASAIATLALRWHQLDMPLFYGDEISYSALSYHLHQTRFHVLGDPGNLEIFHPYLYYVFLAVLTLTLGWKMQVLHGAALLTSSLLVTAVYALARRHASRSTSMMAAVGFILSRLYLSRAVSIEPDFSAAAFSLLALLSLLGNSLKLGSLFFAMSCFCNGPVVIFAPCFAHALSRRIPKRRLTPALIRFFAPAFFGLAAWCVYFAIAVPGVEGSFGPFDPKENFGFIRGFRYVLNQLLGDWTYIIFIDSGRAIISTAILGGIAWGLKRRQAGDRNRPNLEEDRLSALGMIFVQLLFLGFFGPVDPRYATISSALIYVLGAWVLTEMKAALPIRAAMLAAVSTLSLLDWNTPAKTNPWNAYRSSYIEQVRNMQKLIKALERESPGAAVYARWPWATMLESPRSGYAARPFETVILQDVADADRIQIPKVSEKKAFLLSSPGDPLPAAIELRKRATGPCRSWATPHSKFDLCPLN